MKKKGKTKLNRVTIMIEEPIQRKIRRIQAKELNRNRNLTFSQAVNRVLERGL
ncbi:MAG: hypothetical protein GTN97_03540 [Nitrosopumilaceae archaeon]|nr:hypothetical protein [Nitrosopumilaceae archaeon]